MKSALIVIDVQNFHINSKTSELPKKIDELIKSHQFDYILFTQFINKKNSNFVKKLQFKKMFNSLDVDIHKSLQKYLKNNNVFTKTSYSIFKSDKFVRFLKANRIKKLFLCGFDYDACVLASAFEAFDLGYDVRVLTDLTLSHTHENFNKAANIIVNKIFKKN